MEDIDSLEAQIHQLLYNWDLMALHTLFTRSLDEMNSNLRQNPPHNLRIQYIQKFIRRQCIIQNRHDFLQHSDLKIPSKGLQLSIDFNNYRSFFVLGQTLQEKDLCKVCKVADILQEELKEGLIAFPWWKSIWIL